MELVVRTLQASDGFMKMGSQYFERDPVFSQIAEEVYEEMESQGRLETLVPSLIPWGGCYRFAPP